MALLDDIATFLSAKLNSTNYPTQYLQTGVNLFLGRTPAEAPNAVVTIYEYLGNTPDFTMGSGISALEFPRVQVAVRGIPEDYPGTYAWAVLIRNALAGLVMPDATYFPYCIRIETTGIPNYMGFDEVNRPKFTMNFMFTTNSTNGIPNV
jgi:hypothetical protein